MIYYNLANLIVIEVDESYPWKDTLFLDSFLEAQHSETEKMKRCKAKIKVNFEKKISTKKCRHIGSDYYISSSLFFDKGFGARIEKEEYQFILTVSQECNEWLIICLELLLLELDYSFVHAAALEKDGNVLLLPSWGGVGKTATVVKMIKDDKWHLLGDDLVIIGKGEVKAFLKPFVVYGYHKDIFQNLFAGRKKIITNNDLSKLINKIIPITKRFMRPIPGLLAFARKHNPQSMRIEPRKIFNSEEISSEGKLTKVIWMERIVSDNVEFYRQDVKNLISKIASITLAEIFADKSSAIFYLCGAGIVDYKSIYGKIYDTIYHCCENCDLYELNIPVDTDIKDIGNIVMSIASR